MIATDDPLLGSTVGRYRLATLLGEGGMGRVYLGIQPAIGSRVAIKILSDECARDTALLERFFVEAKAVNLIAHESIVNILDLARLDDGRPYIVMEFIEGATLAALVQAQPTPLGGVIQVMIETLSALQAAHAIGIVHRDLKPDNIVVTGEGHAKVLDFGIAKLAPGLSHLSPRTRTGALMGTPAYMAPEQIGAGTVDPRTDVYAAGIVLYEAITGRVPFAGETLFDLMRQHLEVAPVPPSQLRAGLSPAIERVVLTALAKDPAHRFPSAVAMAEALSRAAAELPAGEWRALSRGAAIPGGRETITKLIGPVSRPPRSRPPSSEHTLRDPQRPPEAAKTRLERPVRRWRWPLAIAVIGGVAVATAIALAIATRSGKRAAAPADAAAAIDARPVAVDAAPIEPLPVNATLESNAKAFDPLAFLDDARELARQVYDDAEFTEFELYEVVRPDGIVDLTLRKDAGYYEFRSPSHSVFRPDRKPADELPCYVMVDVTATTIETRVRSDAKCDHPLRKPPRCKLADVLRLANWRGTIPLTVGFLHDGMWFVDRGNQGGVVSFGDCE